MVDYDTIAGGDKFGNFYIDRLPSETSEEVDEDPTGNKIMYEKGYLMGAPHKVEYWPSQEVGSGRWHEVKMIGKLGTAHDNTCWI